MKKSIKVVFIKQFPDDNEGTVYIRTRENGITKKKTLSEKVTSNQWKKYFNPNNQRFKKNNNFPRFLELNYKIDQLMLVNSSMSVVIVNNFLNLLKVIVVFIVVTDPSIVLQSK